MIWCSEIVLEMNHHKIIGWKVYYMDGWEVWLYVTLPSYRRWHAKLGGHDDNVVSEIARASQPQLEPQYLIIGWQCRIHSHPNLKSWIDWDWPSITPLAAIQSLLSRPKEIQRDPNLGCVWYSEDGLIMRMEINEGDTKFLYALKLVAPKYIGF